MADDWFDINIALFPDIFLIISRSSAINFLVHLVSSLYQLIFQNIVLNWLFNSLCNVDIVWQSFVISDFVYFPASVVNCLLDWLNSCQFCLFVKWSHHIFIYLWRIFFHIINLTEYSFLLNISFLKFAFSYNCSLKVSFISCIFLIFHFLFKNPIFICLKLLLNLLKLFFRYNSKTIKRSDIISLNFSISGGKIKIEDSVSISVS